MEHGTNVVWIILCLKGIISFTSFSHDDEENDENVYVDKEYKDNSYDEDASDGDDDTVDALAS